MTPEVGTGLWIELHEGVKVSLDQKMFVSAWLTKAKGLLGCSSCWIKVNRFLKLWPVDSIENGVLWAACLHDFVNKELGKPLHLPNITLAPLRQRGIFQ